MYLIYDGTTNTVLDAIVVERIEEVQKAIDTVRDLVASRGENPDCVCVARLADGEPVNWRNWPQPI